MEISSIVNQMLVLLVLLIVGVAAYKTGITDDTANQKLSRLLLHVVQSAMILGSVMGTELTMGAIDVLLILLYTFIMYALLIALALLVPKVLRVKEPAAGMYRFATVFGNVGFMGFPIIASVFGSEAVFYAALCNMPFNLLIYTLGIVFVSGEKRAFDWRLFVNAPLIATLIALIIFFFQIPVPGFLSEAVNLLGDMTVPMAMLVIGASLGKMPLREVLGDWRIYAFAPIRLILAPVLVWFVLHFFVTDATVLGTIVLLAATPVAANATMICIEYGGDQALASRSVFVTTVLSVVTIPLVAYLLL